MLLIITGKTLLDRSTLYSFIFHRIHGYCYFSLLLLSFTVYVITADCYTVSLLSLYRPNILITWVLIILTELNNNVHGQLTLRLEKLMEKTSSVFWVDLGYRLRSRNTVSLQGSGGWLTSHIVSIVIVIDYLVVWTGSAPGDWTVVPDMYETHLKHG